MKKTIIEIMKQKALEAGFDDLEKYYEYLDKNQFEEEEKERKKWKLTRENFLRWKHPQEGENQVLVNGTIPAILKKNEHFELLREEKRIFHEELDDESRIMKNISEGNGELDGL
uniref:hypothetical protein n=1 Tax=Algoriphagus sp. TaxID=1872435 RepID=UPI004047BA35